ncbi:MAG: response regulator [Bryobacteraceae bacterium]
MARILLVDDNLDLLESRRQAIALDGHHVTAANSVDRALDSLPADCVVADLRLPDLEDGLRLIREVRRRLPDSRIIVSSGFPGSLNGRPEKTMVDHVLQKPYPTPRLLALLRSTLAMLVLGFGLAWAGDIDSHSPILERRANAIGTQSDLPLLMYVERLHDSAGDYLQYTVIFSNEDGGTSTPALLARWGRTTDIEHVYRVWVDASGKRLRATIQTKNHQDVDYTGPFEGDHPVLGVITDNNMVGPGLNATGGERVALKPILVDLSQASRELVMDTHPEMYRVAAEELAREGKVTGLVGDAREYLYIEAKIENRNTRVAARVRVAGRWIATHRGRFDWAIERSGWVRTAVRLPAGAKAAEIGFECLAERGKEPGSCSVDAVGKVFRLDAGYKPGPNLAPAGFKPVDLEPGEMRTWKLR